MLRTFITSSGICRKLDSLKVEALIANLGYKSHAATIIASLATGLLLGTLTIGQAQAEPLTYWITTGNAAGNQGISVGDPAYWDFTTSSTQWYFAGGVFLMKGAVNGTAGITMSLITPSNSTPLASFTFNTYSDFCPTEPSDWCSSAWVEKTFQLASPYLLSANTTYRVQLSSSAAISKKYDAKGSTSDPLIYTESATSNPQSIITVVPGGSSDPSPVPEPPLSLLLAPGLLGLAVMQRKRKLPRPVA